VNTDYIEILWASFKRSSQELLSTNETVEIDEELMEIGPNEVVTPIQGRNASFLLCWEFPRFHSWSSSISA